MAQANAPKGKQPPPPVKKLTPAESGRTASRAGISSAGSKREIENRGGLQELMKKNKLRSMDDETKDFKFPAMEGAMAKMEMGSAGVGSVLAAMIY